MSRGTDLQLHDWQIAVIKTCVVRERWDPYEHVGYKTPAFVSEHVYRIASIRAFVVAVSSQNDG